VQQLQHSVEKLRVVWAVAAHYGVSSEQQGGHYAVECAHTLMGEGEGGEENGMRKREMGGREGGKT
jgi:hypothetical protein